MEEKVSCSPAQSDACHRHRCASEKGKIDSMFVVLDTFEMQSEEVMFQGRLLKTPSCGASRAFEAPILTIQSSHTRPSLGASIYCQMSGLHR